MKRNVSSCDNCFRATLSALLTCRSGLAIAILGIVTTILVAWACALVMDVSAGDIVEGARRIRGGALSYSGYRRHGAISAAWEIWQDTLNSSPAFEHGPPPDELAPLGLAAILLAPLEVDDPDDGTGVSMDGRGFPMISLWHQYDMADGFRIVGGIQWDAVGPVGIPRGLPLIPAPIGFTVDSVVFGIGWFLVLASVATSRRKWRLHRGRCAACGYALGGEFSNGCPECGWNRPIG